MTFAFDERYAMFDITPVENQFILEYMPGAKGDYVKVYLYGLLCCYHPRKEMDVASMSRELGMPEDVILAAYRYWERRGIVRRVSDNPPAWQYVNIKQNNMGGDPDTDREYIRFTRELESSFEDIRDLHGSEIATCYEWKEEMGLSTEVIIMLLKFMARTRGKNFRIRDAEKTAVLLSEEKAYTVEDAEMVLGRDEAMLAGFRKVLRKLGMRFNPSDANLKLYRKWRDEWHFTQEAVEDACDRTGTSTPSLGLVDAILEQAYMNSSRNVVQLNREDLDAAEEKRNNLREILRELGQYGAPTPAQQKLYARMTEMYPNEIILLAARECAAKQRNFDSVMKLLESWQERGFTDEKQIRDHIDAFHGKEEFLKTLRQKWAGKDTDIGQKTLQMLDRWEGSMGFSREMIALAADAAYEAKKPIAYMDKLLTAWNEQGIRTPEAAKEEQKTRGEQAASRKTPGKNVAAQQYTQRDYDDEQADAMRRMLSGVTNGGGEHA